MVVQWELHVNMILNSAKWYYFIVNILINHWSLVFFFYNNFIISFLGPFLFLFELVKMYFY